MVNGTYLNRKPYIIYTLMWQKYESFNCFWIHLEYMALHLEFFFKSLSFTAAVTLRFFFGQPLQLRTCCWLYSNKLGYTENEICLFFIVTDTATKLLNEMLNPSMPSILLHFFNFHMFHYIGISTIQSRLKVISSISTLQSKHLFHLMMPPPHPPPPPPPTPPHPPTPSTPHTPTPPQTN